MPVINRVSEYQDELVAIRQDIHAHPELGFNEVRTAALVAEKLSSFGVDEVVTGIGKTGVVGVIRGRPGSSGKTIALRADMDALPIEESPERDYKSSIPGVMHACGHDGHTAIVLGAAKYLAETRNFDGKAIVIFQPAEEGGAGGLAMVQDGLMDRFEIDEVYGLHNAPGDPEGYFSLNSGAMMAAADTFKIELEGKGAHAAEPHEGIDTVMVGATLVQALHTIAARNVDPVKSVVVSVTTFHAGATDNVIPQTAELTGTVRTLDEELRSYTEERMQEICDGVAILCGAKIRLNYSREYPVTINHPEQAEFAVEVAKSIVGEELVEANCPPIMATEDFSFMLNERPGAYIYLGQGNSAPVHHPDYDFNDEIIPMAVSYMDKLVERGTDR